MAERETGCGIWELIATPPPVVAQLPLQFLFIYDLSLVEEILHPNKAAVVMRSQDGRVLELTKGLAYQCFGTLPMRPLLQLAAYFEVELPEIKTLISVLTALICHILALDPSADEVLPILEKRCDRANINVGLDLLEFAMDDDYSETGLSSFDQKDLGSDLDAMRSKADEEQSYRKAIQQKRYDRHQQQSQSRKTRGAKTQPKKWRGPVNVPQGSDMDIETVRALIPPGFRAFLDVHEARWAVTSAAPIKFFSSKSWGKHGYRESALKVCAAAWDAYIQMYPWETCPVKNLLLQTAASESGAGAGASSSSGAKRARVN